MARHGRYQAGSRVCSVVVLTALVALGAGHVVAQAEWLTIETPHFLITFQEGQESLAQQAAYYAEAAHEKISHELSWEPQEKTQLVLVDSSDDANGFATHHAGYNKEHFWLVYGRPNSTLRSRIETWIYTLAIHEHTHTIHIDMTNGWPGLVRGLFGRMGRPRATPIPQVLWPDLTSPNGDLPVYLVEGFASYMETINTDGGRLRSSLWEMMMRADFVNDQIMTRDQASGRYSYARFSGDAPYYMYGAYFCDYIARIYGQDKLFQIMRENSQGSSLSIDDTFRHALGKPLPEIWDNFIAEAKEIYAKQAEGIKSQGLTEMQRLTRTGEYATSPVFSPDGAQIAYAQGGKRLVPAIRVMKGDGTAQRTAVTTDTVFTGEGFSWSPDGSKLAYSRADYVGMKAVDDLYRFDLQTGQEQRLTSGLRANGPTWSPDGSTIVFVAKKDPLQMSLMAMDSDGANIRELVAGKGEMQFSSPRFSPDGKQIAVAVLTFGGYQDIYLLDADGSGLRSLTQDRANDFAPQWSPDGHYVLFNSDRSGINNIYAYRLSDGQLLQVTNVLYGAFSPSMSPDGKKIALVTYDISGNDVYTIDANPSSWKPVATHREPLPQAPNYAELTKDYKMHAYSPLATLLPRFWQPVLSLGALGALTSGEDLLGHTSYGALVELGFGGTPWFELDATHNFADLTVNSDGPQAPSVSLEVTPQSVTGSGLWPLQQSMRFGQSVNVAATFGRLGISQTEFGPAPIEGLSLAAGWTLNLSGGRDSVRSSYELNLHAQDLITNLGTQLSTGAKAGATWTLNGDFEVAVELGLTMPEPLSGEIDVTIPMIHIEKELGAWPVYFDRILLTGLLGGSLSSQGRAVYYGAVLAFPTYLWYNYRIQPTIGLIIGADGQPQPFFKLGL